MLLSRDNAVQHSIKFSKRVNGFKVVNVVFLDVSFYKPKKSNDCPDGYQGRIGIYEILPVTETIKELIVQRVTSDKIQSVAEEAGMLTMVEDGITKAAQGVTTIEEVLRVIME